MFDTFVLTIYYFYLLFYYYYYYYYFYIIVINCYYCYAVNRYSRSQEESPTLRKTRKTQMSWQQKQEKNLLPLQKLGTKGTRTVCA